METKQTQQKKLPKLTKKQRGFVKDYVETGNGVKSAMKNYDTDDYSTAGSIAVENLQKPAIQNAIMSIADSFTNEEIVQKHKELLNSSRVDHMVFPLGPKTNAEKEEVGEDTFFCLKAKRYNYKIYCDPTMEIGHIGEYIF